MGMAEVGSWHGGAENCTPPVRPYPRVRRIVRIWHIRPLGWIDMERWNSMAVAAATKVAIQIGIVACLRQAEAAGLSPLPRWLQLATQNSIEAILKPLEVMRTAKNPATQLAVANAIGAETLATCTPH